MLLIVFVCLLFYFLVFFLNMHFLTLSSYRKIACTKVETEDYT